MSLNCGFFQSHQKLWLNNSGVKWAIFTRSFASNPNPSYFHKTSTEPLVYRTVGQVFDEAVKKYGDRMAIVSYYENRRSTYAEVAEKSNRLAAGFHKLGMKSGDRIGLWSPNSYNWYIVMIAAAKAGLITVGLNPAFQRPEIAYCIKKVGIKSIVAPSVFKTQNYYKMLTTLIPEIETAKNKSFRNEEFNSLTSVIMDSDEQLTGTYKLNEIYDMVTNQDIKENLLFQEKISPDSPCSVQFSSGTTGLPKAPMLTHYNIINNGIHIGYRNEFFRKHHIICIQVNHTTGMDLTWNPLFHAFGKIIGILAAVPYGGTIVLPSPIFNVTDTLNAIVKEKCTVVYGTPTMYIDLIARQAELKYSLDTLMYAVTGGAPCSPRLYKKIKKVLGLEKMKTVYGLTELTIAFNSLHDETEEQSTGTVGCLHDHLEVKVIDENGDTVPMGTIGELCIRGYSVMLGYYNDLEKTKESLDERRWFKTGDQFILHENGYGEVVGRIKDMIIRGGENIFPVEIENFLNSHVDVRDSYVIGVPDERMGEELCAFIRLHENLINPPTIEDIKQYCKGQIAHFKIPKYMKFIHSFPQTPSGKVQKYKLREQYLSDLNGK